MKHLVLFLILLAHITSGYAWQITWRSGNGCQNITPYVSMLREPGLPKDITAVSADRYNNQFQTPGHTVISLGFTTSVYWLRFTLENNTGDSLWLQLDHAFIPYADFYYKDSASQWTLYRSGYKVKVADKAIKDHFQVFPLLPGKHQYYIRLTPLMHPIRVNVWNSRSYQLNANRQRIIYGIYNGILLFAIAINIFLFFAFRKMYYLLYGLLVFLYTCSSAAVMEGYLVYFFPNIELMYTYKLVPVLDMPVLLAYCLSFLEVKKDSPTLYRFTYAACLFLLAYIVVLHFLPLMAAMKISYVLSLLVFICATTIGISVGRKGNRMGYYFAMAYAIWFVLLLFELVYINTGWPEHIFDLSYVSLAIFVESILLAYLLVKRFYWDKQADENAKFELQRNIMQMQAKFEKEILQTKLEIQEQTLHHISQEIHDNIGQSLTLAKLNLSLYVNQVKPEHQEIEKVITSKDLISNVIRELRDIAKSLNTDYIKTVGLASVIEQQVELLQRTGVFKINFGINGKVERYDLNRELLMFRIVQELINNIVKHANATHLTLLLNYEPSQLMVEVSDNGHGFDLEEFNRGQTKGIGLHNIMDRMKMLGGVVHIESKPQLGTKVTLSFPRQTG